MAQQKINIANLPARRPFGRRRKVCPFSGKDAQPIDYKDVAAFSILAIVLICRKRSNARVTCRCFRIS